MGKELCKKGKIDPVLLSRSGFFSENSGFHIAGIFVLLKFVTRFCSVLGMCWLHNNSSLSKLSDFDVMLYS